MFFLEQPRGHPDATRKERSLTTPEEARSLDADGQYFSPPEMRADSSPPNRDYSAENAMRQYRRLLAVVFFLGLLLAVFELSGLRDHFSLAFLQQRIAENRISGLLIFIVLFSLGNLIQIPGWIFLAAAVLTLGRSWGGLATYVAACISCALTFFTIRLLGGDALRQLKSKAAVRILAQLDAHPIGSVLLLRALFQTVPANLPFEVIVVDNASTDGTSELLGRAAINHPRLRLISETANSGFPRACNHGAQESRGEFLLFLNNDTIPLRG